MEFAAEVFDQVQRLFDLNGFNDHQLHCVLRFAARPDAAVLKKAVIASIEAIPILGTRYVANDQPHWESIDPGGFDRAFATAGTEAEFEEFLASSVDEGEGPQVSVRLLDTRSAFAVAIKLNHMICDAAGFKEYLYFLCRIYAGLTADSAFRPVAIDGDRSIRGVLKRFGPGVKLKSLLQRDKDNNRAGGERFPLDEYGAVRPFILTRKLVRERVAALRDYCRANGATLNDAVLTAFYRCVFRRLKPRPGAELWIPIMVDMRRHLGEAERCASLTNLSSMVGTQIAYLPDEGFADTLGRVKAIMDENKVGGIGLNAFVKLDLTFRLLGDKSANRILRTKLKNPLICMTNIGVLDADRLALGEARPYDAFMCGSVKYKPYFQLAMSSFAGEITLSVNEYGSAADRESIHAFLDEVEAELIPPIRSSV
jgi:NRPS condensation-like uncharacterized protein